MLEAVRDWRDLTGEMVGVKPAGGIRTSKDAIKFLVTVSEVAGEDWLDHALVPLRRLQPAQRPASCSASGCATGAYSGADYVTDDSPSLY